MGIFDRFKKKSGKTRALNQDPEKRKAVEIVQEKEAAGKEMTDVIVPVSETGEPEDHWNESESISLSLSKGSVREDTVTQEEDCLSGQQDDSLIHFLI